MVKKEVIEKKYKKSHKLAFLVKTLYIDNRNGAVVPEVCAQKTDVSDPL